MARWQIQYIFLDEDGETRMTNQLTEAPDRDAARDLAQKLAPTKDCVFSVHPESDDQFLGNVRTQAMSQAGRDWHPDRDPGLLVADDETDT